VYDLIQKKEKENHIATEDFVNKHPVDNNNNIPTQYN